MNNVFFVCICLIVSCTGCCTPRSAAYQSMYAHLQSPLPPSEVLETDFFLVVLVEARHLDYTCSRSLLKTLAKHPSDASKNGDVGHAWIYIQGIVDGQKVYLEGGQSGELGVMQAKYFDGIMNYIDFGYANPSRQCSQPYRFEPNPAKYLWETLNDGFFQEGAGRHSPTFAAKIDITPRQFERILEFVNHYDYTHYALTNNQCSSFVAQVSSLAGLDLECEVTIPIDPYVFVGNTCFLMWSDPCYANLTISSPDVLECSLMNAVANGEAECALEWYKNKRPPSCWKQTRNAFENTCKFPERFLRWQAI